MDVSGDTQRLAAEQQARVLIDRQLADAGWSVQDKRDLNLFVSTGVAVREFHMAAGHGRADYLLYVDKNAVGVIEAKPRGATPTLPSQQQWPRVSPAQRTTGKARDHTL